MSATSPVHLGSSTDSETDDDASKIVGISVMADLTDSDSDDDYYSNPLARFHKKKTVPVRARPQGQDRKPPQSLEELQRKRQWEQAKEANSDDDLVLLDEDDVTCDDRMQRCAKRAREEEDRRRKRELEEIQNRAFIRDARPGEVPANFFCTPAVEESSARIREMQRLQGSGHTQLDVASPSAASLSSSRLNTSVDGGLDKSLTTDSTVVPLMIKNLDDDSAVPMPVQQWKMSDEIGQLREFIAGMWKCPRTSVNLSMNGMELADEETAESLGVKHTELMVVTALRIDHGSRASQSAEKREEGELDIKCQHSTSKRPVLLRVHKDTEFVEIKKLICREMGLESISRIEFDNEPVNDSDSPSSLDMDHEDCIDVYE